MSHTRRTAKRSVIGQTVAAKRDYGVHYEPATVLEASSGPVLPEKFLVKFESDSTSHWLTEKQIIGHGFQPISAASLQLGQLVYCTVGHRETPARIIHLPLPPASDPYALALEDGSGQTIERKKDDMRLIKSRKSARITAEKDYHSLALGKVDLYGDMDTTPPPPSTYPSSSAHFLSAPSSRKPRVAAAAVDMMAPCSYSPNNSSEELRYSSPDVDSEESLGGEMDEVDEQEENRGEHDDVLMDECGAAMVLLSLGASPHSKGFDFADDAGFSSASSLSGSASSWPSRAAEGRRSHRLLTKRSLLRDSASSTTGSSDEGIELTSGHQMDPEYAARPRLDTGSSQRPNKRRSSTSIVFHCTWPQCQHMETSRAGIKRHIQSTHFTSAGQATEDLEFYYNEEEIAGSLEVEVPTTLSSSLPVNMMSNRTMTARNGHHQPTPTVAAAASDQRPIYLSTRRHRSTLSHSSDTHSNASRTSTRFSGISKPKTAAINIPGRTKRRDFESASAPQPQQFDAMSVSSIGSGSGKAAQQAAQIPREVKKCRKVYGMENREMWCTQCKWKKACTRFAPDGS